MVNIINIINDTIFKFLIENFRYNLAGFGHDEKKIALDKAYHVTPINNASLIEREGLIPHKPKSDEPNAVFLSSDIFGALRLAYQLNKSKGLKNIDWVIYEFNTDGITLYKDPYSVSETGVYSYEPIKPNRIQNKIIIDSEIIKTQKNWKLFWDWFMWDKPKPDFVQKFKLLSDPIK